MYRVTFGLEFHVSAPQAQGVGEQPPLAAASARMQGRRAEASSASASTADSVNLATVANASSDAPSPAVAVDLDALRLGIGRLLAHASGLPTFPQAAMSVSYFDADNRSSLPSDSPASGRVLVGITPLLEEDEPPPPVVTPAAFASTEADASAAATALSAPVPLTPRGILQVILAPGFLLALPAHLGIVDGATLLLASFPHGASPTISASVEWAPPPPSPAPPSPSPPPPSSPPPPPPSARPRRPLLLPSDGDDNMSAADDEDELDVVAVGGVLGGLTALALTLALSCWWYSRRRGVRMKVARTRSATRHVTPRGASRYPSIEAGDSKEARAASDSPLDKSAGAGAYGSRSLKVAGVSDPVIPTDGGFDPDLPSTILARKLTGRDGTPSNATSPSTDASGAFEYADEPEPVALTTTPKVQSGTDALGSVLSACVSPDSLRKQAQEQVRKSRERARAKRCPQGSTMASTMEPAPPPSYCLPTTRGQRASDPSPDPEPGPSHRLAMDWSQRLTRPRVDEGGAAPSACSLECGPAALSRARAALQRPHACGAALPATAPAARLGLPTVLSPVLSEDGADAGQRSVEERSEGERPRPSTPERCGLDLSDVDLEANQLEGKLADLDTDHPVESSEWLALTMGRVRLDPTLDPLTASLHRSTITGVASTPPARAASRSASRSASRAGSRVASRETSRRPSFEQELCGLVGAEGEGLSPTTSLRLQVERMAMDAVATRIARVRAERQNRRARGGAPSTAADDDGYGAQHGWVEREMVYGLNRASRPRDVPPSPKTWLSREVERSEAKACQGNLSDSDGSSSRSDDDGDDDGCGGGGGGGGRESPKASRVTSRRPSAEWGRSRRPSAEGRWVRRASEERLEPRSRRASAEVGSTEPAGPRRLRLPSVERLARSRRPSAEGGAKGGDAELEAEGVQQRAPRRASLTEDGHQVGLSSLSVPWASSEYTVAEGAGRTGGVARGSRRPSADEEAPPVGTRMKRRLSLDKYVLKGSTL